MKLTLKKSIIISVCLCTYKRPHLLAKCLNSIINQTYKDTYEIIVTDNDNNHSGEHIVKSYEKACADKGIQLTYLVEPVQNIALARNRCVKAARGCYVAFIDDDEYASMNWLRELYDVMIDKQADGVWGAVVPIIPESFPSWIHRSKIFHRNILIERCFINRGNITLCTSNVLIKRKLLTLRPGPFDKGLGRTGGSDGELFNWIQNNSTGVKFVLAAEAKVFETLEENRKYIRWHLRRAYRGGWGYSRRNTKREGIIKGLIKTLYIIPPSTLRALGLAIINYNNIRYAGLIVINNIATNAGKLGYFFGLKIEEYKG